MAAAGAIAAAAARRKKKREEENSLLLTGDAENWPAAFGLGSEVAARAMGMGIEEWRAIQVARHEACEAVKREREVQSRLMDLDIGCCAKKCKCHSFCAQTQKVVTDTETFQTFITLVIFVAAIQVGIQTYSITSVAVINILLALDEVIMGVFMCEVVMKTLAMGKKPWEYLFTMIAHRPFIKLDLWNIFDFTIVAAALMPISGNSFVAVLRLLRLLRVLKLVKALPKLRIVVMAVMNSVPAVFYNCVLLFLLMYLYGVFGVIFFGANDPIHYGTLHAAMFTLYRCATCEDWTDVMYINEEGCDKYGYSSGDMAKICVEPTAYPFMSYAYHISFIMVASWMILSLLIGVISDAMSTAQDDVSGDDDGGMAEMNPSGSKVIVYDIALQRLKTLALSLAEECVATETRIEQEDGVVVEEWERRDGTTCNVCRKNRKVYDEGGILVGRWGEGEFAGEAIPDAGWWE